MRGPAVAVLLAAASALPAAAQAVDVTSLAPEQEAFASLEGPWSVHVLLHGGGRDPVLAASGRAEVRTRLGGRFLEAAVEVEPGAPALRMLYLVAYDRRNERYQVVALDDTASYLVLAQGARRELGGWVATEGWDDDPAMAAMGLEKAFVFALDLDPADGWAIQTRFVDTRTPERLEQDFMTVRFFR